MSDRNEENPPEAPAAAATKETRSESASAAAPGEAPRRAGKWRRRLRRLAVAAVVAVLLFRLALSFLLPTVVHKTARSFGFDLSYGRLDLNLLGTQAGIWDVTLRAKDRPDNILHADYGFANISSLALFKLKLHAYRLEVDGMQLALIRKPDGTIPVLEQLAEALKSKEPPPPSEPLRFDSPLAVEAVRINHVKVSVRDETLTPPYEDAFTLGVRVSDVGAPGKPATLALELFSGAMLQALRLQGEADLKPDTLTARLNFSMFGLRLNEAQAYLASLGVRTDDLPIGLTGDADVVLKSVPSRPGALSGTASVCDMRLSAGQEDAVRLASGTVSIQELSPSSLHVSRVEAEGGLLRLRRTRDGSITFASLSPAKAPAKKTPTTEPATATATAPSGTAFAWRVDEVVAKGLAGEFRDALASPERQFAATVATFEVKNLASAGGKDDAATLKLELAVKDIADQVRIAGKALPFADAPAATVEFDASGVRADALRPYLAPLGIEPMLRAGRFRATLEASAKDLAGSAPTIGVTLRDIRLDDQDSGLFNMPLIRIAGLRREPATGAIEVDEIAATGPSLTVRRLGPNVIELPGVRYRKPDPTPAAAAAPIAAAGAGAIGAAAAGVAALPVVRVGKLSWGGANVRLEDRSAEGLEPIDLSDARIDVEGLVLDQRPDAPPAPPGKVSGRFSSPGLAGAVQLEGTLTPGRESFAADLSLTASGLKLTRLAPFLKPFGIEPRLADGSFKAAAHATVAQQGETTRLTANVRGVELKDGDVQLLAMQDFRTDSLDMSPAGYQVGDVSITRPYARLERDADGGLIVGGIKLSPPTATAQPTTTTTQPATTQPAVDFFAVLASVPPLGLKSLKVDGAEVDWLDRATSEPLELKVAASASLESVSLNRPEPQTAIFQLVLSAPKLAERIHVEGTIDPRRDSLAAVANVDAEGLNPGGLAGYLPDGIEPAMSAGSFKTHAAVTIARHPDGGIKGGVEVNALALRDGAAGAAPLAALDRLDVGLDRFDPTTGDVALSKLSLTGVEATLAREAGGALSLVGLRIAPTTETSSAPAQPPAAGAPAPVDSAPVDVRDIVAQSKQTLPMLSLESLDVRLKRLEFRDDLRKAEPVALADFRVANNSPIRLLGKKPESNPAAKLTLSGAIEPVAKRVDVVVEAAPFAERPAAKVTFDAAGIDGAALTRVAPELAESLDGSGLADGRFQATFEAEANVRRRGPTQIDLSRGVEVTTFALTKTAFRDGESGPLLAGVGSVRGEQAKIETRSGDITIRSLEITDLAATAWRDAGGIHVLGMRIKGTEVKPDESAPSHSPAQEPSHAEVAVASPGPPDPAAVSASKPEVRIDRLTVSGLDFRFDDRASDPPVLIPITALDAEIRGLSSLAAERERPVRFNVALGAGKVSLPKKLRGGVLTGALGDVAKLAGGKRVDATPELEDRDFFAQIVAAGNVKLYPKPAGRAQASVNGIELAAIRGLAASSGIGLNGGTFDGRIEMKTREDEKLDVRSRFVLTDLSVTEPPNGPIARYLGLPAPLDVVIGAAEAPDKSITLPLHFQVDGATPKGIGPAAVRAVSQVLITAVASAPVKTVTGVVGLFGKSTKETEVVQDPPMYLEFAAGLTSLDPASERQLTALLARAKRDKKIRIVIEHELGQEDVAVAARRANPPTQQVTALAENLRARRRALLRRRDELLIPAKASAANPAAVGSTPPAALVAYRELQGELSVVEDAFDRLYDLQRPGAERQADRRTRATAIEIADARLDRIRSAIRSTLDAAGAERVRVGVARFTPRDEATSRLVISVARQVPKTKRSKAAS